MGTKKRVAILKQESEQESDKVEEEPYNSDESADQHGDFNEFEGKTLLEIEEELEKVKTEQSQEWKEMFSKFGLTELDQELLRDDILLFMVQQTDDYDSNSLHLTCK